MKSKEMQSTKDSRSAVLSTDQRLRNYQELYREIKHLYEINKEIFKINISSSDSEPFGKVVSVLSRENKFLYDMIVKHFVKNNSDSVLDQNMTASLVNSTTERKCGNQCIAHSNKLFARIEKLERELLANSRKETGLAQGNVKAPDFEKTDISRDNLKFFKDNKVLEQKLLCTEMRLSKIITVKNELLRQNFVS
jgi:hypothetical protein